MEQPTPAPQHDDEITLLDIWVKLKEWWAHAWRRKWIIILVGLLAGVGNIGWTISKPKQYVAQVKLAMSEGGSSMGSLGSLASQFGFNLGGGGGDMFSDDNCRSSKKLDYWFTPNLSKIGLF